MPASARAPVAISGLAIVLLANGCTPLHVAARNPLAAPRMSPDSVGLEIIWVRFPEGDPEMTVSIWDEIQEQTIPTLMRERLASNGFRAGVMAGRLPDALEQHMRLSEDPPTALGQVQTLNLVGAALAQRRALQLRAGHPGRILCTGEGVRHPQLHVLFVGDDGDVTGRTYIEALGLMSVVAQPADAGRVELELTPELEYGQAVRNYVAQGDALGIEFRPPHETFVQLRVAAPLAPGEMLVLTCQPNRRGSLGHRFFTAEEGTIRQQRLLIVRVAQTQHDDLFPRSGAPSTQGP